MAMLLMTADRLFGMRNPLKRNTYNKSRKYRRFMIALMVITPFLFGFPRFMSADLVDHGDDLGRRWCVSKSVIAEWNSTEGTISDLLIALALCMYVLPVAVELFLCVCLRLTSTRRQKKKKIRGHKNRSAREFVSQATYGNVNSNGVFGTPTGETEVDSRKRGKKPKHLKLQEAIVQYAYLDTIIYACLWGPWYLTMLIVIRIERSSSDKVYIGTDVNHQKRIMHCIIYLSLTFVYIYFVVWPLRCVRMSNPAKWKHPQRDYSMIIKSERTEELPRRERRNAHVDAGLSRNCVLTNTTYDASNDSLYLAEETETIPKIPVKKYTLAVP
ncbi:unnamed protein product [Oikopleura dioica]|uniref:G-protein coupled receptors family 1 profile domain-containing protein n=1 Tax=Oikopleura dioica TaxID=34765 RepID=E4WTK1_OIKDI|nr:unnamed protein product [Oikopleura dioica]